MRKMEREEGGGGERKGHSYRGKLLHSNFACTRTSVTKHCETELMFSFRTMPAI